jgi:hypothetical protein
MSLEWKKLVTSETSGTSTYINHDTLGKAGSITSTINPSQGGTGLTAPDRGVLMYGALASAPNAFSTVTTGTDGHVLTYNGSTGDFEFGALTFAGGSADDYITTNADAIFNSLEVTGTLNVSETLVWSGEELATNANIIALNNNNSAPGTDDQFGLKAELSTSAYVSLVWDHNAQKWIVSNDLAGLGAAVDAEIALMQVANYSGSAPSTAGENGVGTLAVDSSDGSIYIQTAA